MNRGKKVKRRESNAYTVVICNEVDEMKKEEEEKSL